MRRWPLVVAAGLALAALVRADGAPPPDDGLRQFRRDRRLIESLVEGSLKLASADDALKRADCCTALAESLADEVRDSADRREKDRAEEMGDHLTALLERGVTANLTRARTDIPPGSAEEKRLFELHRRADGVLGRIEERLKCGEDGETQHTLTAVHLSRVEVDRVMQGKDKATERGKGKGGKGPEPGRD